MPYLYGYTPPFQFQNKRTFVKPHTSLPKAILIAGTHSGCGKTSVSLGLMAALAGQGIRVQPFKAGPDFIDPGHHEAVTGVCSHNLDGWMLDRDTVREIFARRMQDIDVGIVEGAMGLFDGFSGTNDQGSAAQLAKILNIPVVLVVDAKGMGRSAVAMVKGYVTFDPELSFAGVIFNRVGSPRHEELLRQAMETSLPHVPVLGCLPKDDNLAINSRHLGLVMAHELESIQRTRQLASWVDSAVDVRKLTNDLPPISLSRSSRQIPCKPEKVRVGVARDKAFCFYYRENLRALEQAGATLVFFSPLEDTELPEHLDGLYLGGGYPELFARTLADNRSMRDAVKAFSLEDRPVYAECGGFMYLMKTLQDKEGTLHQMAGIFDCACAMQNRFAALGYREVTLGEPSILGPGGSRFRGHEFHYSTMQETDPVARNIYQTTDRKGPCPKGRGLNKHRTLGSYIHLHFGSNPDLAPSFVRACAGKKLS